MRPWAFFVRLFATQERGTTLACFRIALAALTVSSLLSLAFAGLVDVVWVDARYGGMRTLRPDWLVAALGGATPSVVWGLWWVALAAAFTLLVGLFGRVSSFLLLQSYLALTSLNPDAVGGYDSLTTNALWLLTLGNPTATLALDCRLREGAWTSGGLVSAWPRHLLIFQILFVYTATGLQKTSILWTPAGEYAALYYVLQDPTWTRFDGELFAWLYPVTQLATAVTWHWEQLSLGLLLYYYFRQTRDRPGRLRRWLLRWDLRVAWVAIGIALHVGILVLLEVGPFSLVAMAYYMTLFSSDEVERWGHGVAGRLRGVASSSETAHSVRVLHRRPRENDDGEDSENGSERHAHAG